MLYCFIMCRIKIKFSYSYSSSYSYSYSYNARINMTYNELLLLLISLSKLCIMDMSALSKHFFSFSFFGLQKMRLNVSKNFKL